MTAVCALILFLTYFRPQPGYSIDTITVTQFLNDSKTIVSSNKIFTLGFFSPPNSTNRYVGIWYSKPSVKKVVWVANNNNPIKDSSGVFKISKDDGNLQVLDGKTNQVIWSSNVTEGKSSTAQLLDSGNLVLRSNEGVIIWESFDHPTDTFLPNMKLKITKGTQGTVFRSWKSPSDPSDGRFTLGMDTYSRPQLLVWDGNRPHWRSGPWNGNILIGVQFNFVDFINAQIVVSSDNEGTTTMTYFYPNRSLLSTYKLSTEGRMTHIWWDDGKRNWEVEWQMPEKECDLYGKCGPFGTCNSQRQSSMICQCLKGFEPKNKTEWSKGNWNDGCSRRRRLQCEGGNGNEDGFLRLRRMKVPDYAEWRLGLNIDGCRSHCLSNCSCLAYAYDIGVGCMTWSTSLIDIQEFSVSGVDLYLRLSHSELGGNNKVKVVIAITASLLGIAIVAVLLCFLQRQRANQQAYQKKRMKETYTTGDNKNQEKLEELPLFKFEKLAAATNNFHESNKLGRGGFGVVYKGKLENGQEIAVKRLSKTSGQGLEEFMNEVLVISKLQHRNLVRLLGCSVEGKEKLLVYEYMPNKSLDAFIFVQGKREALDWKRRFNIIEGICRGLLYLHRDSRLRIIHRDLKASNILLDEELNPKISDFGMARIFRGDQDQDDTTRVVGTYGYMAPEYAMEGLLSEKSDVFSFGVLILEIVSGKRNSFFSPDDEHCLSLLEYAWKSWDEKRISLLIDPLISVPHYEEEIMRCVQVGLLCVQEFAKDRPSIPTVISMLNGEISELPHPNRPEFAQMSRDIGSSKQSEQDTSMNYVSITEISGR